MQKRLWKTMIFFLLMIPLLIAGGTSLAQESGPPGSRSEAPRAPTAILDDGGTPEVGVEWITDWPGTADDRANWYYSANNLYNELGSAGWVKRFNYGNTNAWERDFKAAMYGGINDYVIDSVDLAMIGTHGSSAWDPRYGIVLSSVYFSSNNDDWQLSPGEAYRAYGNNDLEWLAFDSCSVLRNDSMWYWYNTFDGLHLMAGFANTMYVVYPGDGGVWGDQMQKKGWWIFGHGAKTVTQAWFSAVEDQQPSGVRARVLAETLDSYNDYIWGQGYVSPDYPNNGAYWYWDHVAGTPPPLQLNQPAPITELPALQIVTRTVDQEYVMNIGSAFGLTSTILTSPDGKSMFMVGGMEDEKQLRVDVVSGGFLYQDLGELWTHPEISRTLPNSEPEARRYADNFLSQHKNIPGSFFYDQQIPPTVELEGAAEGMVPGIEATRAFTATDYAIHYARTFDIGGGTRLSIVGPGSRQNLYVGDGNMVIGFKGGWREVQLAPGKAMIPIISDTEAWNNFMADPNIALAKLPAATVYDRTGKPEPTLGYYEQPLTMGQQQLIPVWIFVADLFTDVTVPPTVTLESPTVLGLVVSDAFIYVPAAADPTTLPVAAITEPTAGLVIAAGQTVDLSGMASGGTPPYSYQWTSSRDGILGNGDTLTNVPLTGDVHSSHLAPNQITLEVIDANGLQASATVDVLVLPPLYLPTIFGP